MSTPPNLPTCQVVFMHVNLPPRLPTTVTALASPWRRSLSSACVSSNMHLHNPRRSFKPLAILRCADVKTVFVELSFSVHRKKSLNPVIPSHQPLIMVLWHEHFVCEQALRCLRLWRPPVHFGDCRKDLYGEPRFGLFMYA